MLNKIRAFFAEEWDRRGDGAVRHPIDELQLAAATLLVEAARMDDAIDEGERRRIVDLVRRRFGLSAEEGEALLSEAMRETDGPLPWHRITATIKDRFSHEDRIELIEMLWEVVYADGELHHLESNMMRRIGGLLYVSDQDRGAARLRVLDRLGLSDPSTGA